MIIQLMLVLYDSKWDISSHNLVSVSIGGRWFRWPLGSNEVILQVHSISDTQKSPRY